MQLLDHSLLMSNKSALFGWENCGYGMEIDFRFLRNYGRFLWIYCFYLLLWSVRLSHFLVMKTIGRGLCSQMKYMSENINECHESEHHVILCLIIHGGFSDSLPIFVLWETILEQLLVLERGGIVTIVTKVLHGNFLYMLFQFHSWLLYNLKLNGFYLFLYFLFWQNIFHRMSGGLFSQNMIGSVPLGSLHMGFSSTALVLTCGTDILIGACPNQMSRI